MTVTVALHRRILLLAALLIASSACAPRGSHAQQPAATVERRLDIGGQLRRYLLHVPARLSPSAPAAVLLVFHGRGGTAEYTANRLGFRELADREGFVAVFAEGAGRRWHDGHVVPLATGTDDFAYVSALLADVGRVVTVDPRRVYAAGHSNGAFFAQALACRMPGTFAAIAPVAGQLATSLAPVCRDAQPVSMLQIHGTNDAIVPFAGGTLRPGVELLPVEASAALRAERAGCDTQPHAVAMPDGDASDATTVRRVTWTSCANNLAVELYIIDGGGHGWPSHRASNRQAQGATSREIDAAQLIWEFFKAHPGS